MKKLKEWIRLTFSSSKAISYNRQLGFLSFWVAVGFGMAKMNEAMWTFIALTTSFAGITALKKG